MQLHAAIYFCLLMNSCNKFSVYSSFCSLRASSFPSYGNKGIINRHHTVSFEMQGMHSLQPCTSGSAPVINILP